MMISIVKLLPKALKEYASFIYMKSLSIVIVNTLDVSPIMVDIHKCLSRSN